MHEDVLKREALEYFQECLVGFQEAEESYALHITFLQYVPYYKPPTASDEGSSSSNHSNNEKPKKGIGRANIRDSATGNTTQCKLASRCQIISLSFPFHSQSHAWLRSSAWTPFRKHGSFEPATYRSPPSTECGSGFREARLQNRNPTQRAAGFPCSSRNTPLCSPTLVPGHPSSPFRLGGAGA